MVILSPFFQGCSILRTRQGNLLVSKVNTGVSLRGEIMELRNFSSGHSRQELWGKTLSWETQAGHP